MRWWQSSRIPSFHAMMDRTGLSERERCILEAIVETYIETAEPVASQTVQRRSGLGLSSASIRSTMSDLEAKKLLFHPHASSGRIPTDRAYRVYVDTMLRHHQIDSQSREQLEAELTRIVTSHTSEDILQSAAHVLGILTQELGVAVAPALEQLILQQIELVAVASDRLLLVLHIRSAAVRTIYVRLAAAIAPELISEVQRILNQRFAGESLLELRSSAAERLQDAASGEVQELLDIVLAEGEELFRASGKSDPVLLGSAGPLADQPEFATAERMRSLLNLTDRRDLLQEALAQRRRTGVTISIGGEHGEPDLTGFTLVTSTYRRGGATGVIGVLGPTRMPYNKIVGLVDHASRLIEGLMR